MMFNASDDDDRHASWIQMLSGGKQNNIKISVMHLSRGIGKAKLKHGFDVSRSGNNMKITKIILKVTSPTGCFQQTTCNNPFTWTNS